MEELRKKLLAQGLGADLVDSMLASMKPKKARKPAKKSPFHAGFSTSRKVDKLVTTYTYCQCCGSVHVQEVMIKTTSDDSPDKQRLECSVCKDCPAFLRSFSYEELVSIVLLGAKPQMELHQGSVKFRGQLAKMVTPEEVITFTNLTDHNKEKKNASNP